MLFLTYTQQRLNRLMVFVILTIACCQVALAQPLYVNEFMASNKETITDENGDYEDWIEIYNAGATDIDLANYYFSDDPEEITLWQIPATDPAKTTVPAGGYLILWADKDTEDGENHLDLKLGAGGESVILTAPDGVTIIDDVTFGPQADDISYGRTSDGAVDFVFFSIPSPGAANVPPGPTTFVANLSIPISGANDDGEEFPGGSVTLNSSDIEMVQDGANVFTVAYRFNNIDLPADAVITNAYLQFYTEEVKTGSANITIKADASTNPAPLASSIGNFSSRSTTNASVDWVPAPWPTIDANGDDQQSPDLSTIVQELIGTSGWESGRSIVFMMTGSGTRTTYAYDLNPSKAAVLHLEAEIPLPTDPIDPVFINEISAFATPYTDESGKREDWIELYNPNANSVNIGGLYLTDDFDNLDKWQISGSIEIPAGGFVTFFADEDLEEGPLHADFKLKSGGEEVALVQLLASGLTIIDSVAYEEIPFLASYGRVTDGASVWQLFGTDSPDASNNGALAYLESPNVSLASGGYNSAQIISLSHPDSGADLYYTLDGSLPDATATLYSAPILLSSSSSLRAVAIKAGAANSQVAEAAYMINDARNMPVLFLTTDPDNFFDDETGIYVDGTNGVVGFCSSVPVNWARDWERPCNLKMILPDGEVAFDVNAGVEISGACSRGNAMKSLAINLREKIFGSDELDYEVFPQRSLDKFQRFKIRGSGQDYFRLGFRDMLNQTLLFTDIDLELQAGRPVILYLNGEFWGIHNMREKFAGEHFEELYDVKEKDLDIIKSPGLPWSDVKKGTETDYLGLFNFVQNGDLTSQEDYDYFDSQVDVNEFTNYWIAMTYMANYDWPANNLTIWRDRENQSKWRYGVADTDGSTNNILTESAAPEFNTFALINEPNSTTWPNHSNSTLFLRKLLERTDYRDEFIQRTCTFMEVIFPESRTHPLIDSVAALFQPNLPEHLDNWAFDNAMGGSEFAWNGWISEYKTFWEDRPEYMRDHLNDFYGLDEYYDLTIDFDEATEGDVFVNSNTMEIPYNYTGTYFKNIPLRLTAVADPGFQFSHWLETGVTDAVIDYVGTIDATLTPIFVPEGEILTLTCPADITISEVPGTGGATANWATPNPNTSCASGAVNLTQTAGPSSGSIFPIGSSTITYEATDDCGNVETCSFVVTVTAFTSTLNLTCPANIAITAPTGSAGTTVSWIVPMGTSDCSTGTVTTTQTGGAPSGSFFPIGTSTITYTASDACGTSTSCSFDIIVLDGSGTLSLTCPADQSYVIPAGANAVLVTWALPTATTTCGGGAGNPNCGTVPAGFTAIGAIGEQEYFLSDAKIPWTAAQENCTSFDGNLIAIGSMEENQLLADNVTEVIHIGYNDAEVEGNFAWSNGEPVTYTNLGPTPNNTQENDYGYWAPWDGKWGFYSNLVYKKYVMELDCGGGSSIALNQIGGPANNSTLTAGTYTITYEATDDCGDTQLCSFTVNVENGSQQGIELTCPADLTLTAESGTGGAIVTWPAATATTDCTTSGLSIVQTSGALSGSFFPIGTAIITYEATDACGDLETCSFTVNVLPSGPNNEYCTTQGSQPWEQWIGNVSFNSINNDSGKNGYGDYTNLSTSLNANSNYAFSLTPAFSWTQWDEYVRVWIDYNQDFDFDDAGEMVFEQIIPAGTNGGSGNIVSGNISIPDAVNNGATRMRVSMKQGAYANPCESFVFGEVEDYTVVINGGNPVLQVGNPADLLYLDVIKDGVVAQLNWVTNTEYKNDYFVIERSQDGIRFETMDELSSLYADRMEVAYQYRDLQPGKGWNYYRIKAVFDDGSFRYSTRRKLRFEHLDEDWIVFPNPAQEVLNVSLGQFANERVSIQIIDALGQVVYSKVVDRISLDALSIDLSEVQNGLYLISVELPNTKRLTKTFIVKRLY